MREILWVFYGFHSTKGSFFLCFVHTLNDHIYFIFNEIKWLWEVIISCDKGKYEFMSFNAARIMFGIRNNFLDSGCKKHLP